MVGFSSGLNLNVVSIVVIVFIVVSMASMVSTPTNLPG